MSRLAKVWLLLALGAMLSAPAWAQMALPVVPVVPIAPNAAPCWAPVPGAPMVYAAPNISGDLYRCHGKYYYYSGGNWYHAKHLRDRWRPVRHVPRELYLARRPHFAGPRAW